MATISLASILSMLSLPTVFARRNDPQYWSGWIEEQGKKNRKLEVTEVSLEESGLDMTVRDGTTEVKLSAVPHNLKSTTVFVNGVEQPDASLVFAPKFTLTDLTRYAFDFRPVQVEGKTLRFNTRYDP